MNTYVAPIAYSIPSQPICVSSYCELYNIEPNSGGLCRWNFWKVESQNLERDIDYLRDNKYNKIRSS